MQTHRGVQRKHKVSERFELPTHGAETNDNALSMVNNCNNLFPL